MFILILTALNQKDKRAKPKTLQTKRWEQRSDRCRFVIRQCCKWNSRATAPPCCEPSLRPACAPTLAHSHTHLLREIKLAAVANLAKFPKCPTTFSIALHCRLNDVLSSTKFHNPPGWYKLFFVQVLTYLTSSLAH